jgi:hypothetical protein
MEAALAKVQEAYKAMQADKTSQKQADYMAAASAATAALGSGNATDKVS